jgi:hypothetical protein
MTRLGVRTLARGLTCDVCKKPIEYVAAKLNYIPAGNGRRATHSDYTHHADVGPCCSERILDLFQFHKRRTRKEYNEARRGGAKIGS